MVNQCFEDFKRELHGNNKWCEYLGKVEERTKVNRAHIVLGLAGAVLFYLAFGPGSDFLCDIIGFLYPAYASLKSIEGINSHHAAQWMTYWVLYTLIGFVEDHILGIDSPYLYWALKAAFLTFLMCPHFNGAQKIYDTVIKPYRSYSHSIEHKIEKAKHNAAKKFDNLREDIEEEADKLEKKFE